MTWGADYASVDGNAPPDFAKLRAAGASFIWIRGAFAYWDKRHSAWHLKQDSDFLRDWEDAKAAGLVRGAYLFPVLSAAATPEEQVANLDAAITAAGGLAKGDFPPCLDIEFPKGIAGTGLDRAGVMVWIRRAVAAMRATFGCHPIIYTSGRVWDSNDTDCLASPPAPDLTPCPLWLARYAYPLRQPAVIPPPDNLPPPPVPHPWASGSDGEWHAHQDQGDAWGVPGFTATVDVDRFRVAKQGDRGGHIAWMQRKLGLTPDGVFGPVTAQHITTFQRSRSLVADGVVGPRTFAYLARV